jgi:hypothetical protein
MRRLGRLLLLAAPATCAHRAPQSAHTATVATRAAAPSAPLAIERRPAAAEPCSLHATYFRPAHPVALLTRSGRPFGSFVSADEVTLTPNRAGGALETTVYGMRFHTPPRALRVYAAKPLAIGAFRPAAETPLLWTPTPTASTLALSPPPDVRVTWIGATPSRQVECTALSLEPTYDLPEPTGSPDYFIDARPSVTLTDPPGEKPVARVRGGDRLPALLLQKRAHFAEVRVLLRGEVDEGASVTGWVDASLVHPGADEWEGTGSAPGMHAEGSSDWWGCGGNYALFVDAGQGIEAVGEVLAETRVEVIALRGEYARIQVLGPAVRDVPAPFTLLPGVQMLMRRSDMAGCTE